MTQTTSPAGHAGTEKTCKNNCGKHKESWTDLKSDTPTKSKTLKTQSGVLDETQRQDALKWTSSIRTLSCYENNYDLSCLSFTQLEMDMMLESIEATMAMTMNHMDEDTQEWALPILRGIRDRIIRAD